MNEHAREIWQTWLDGKEVQYYAQFGESLKGEIINKWIDADPSNPELFKPQERYHLWRIKPESKTKMQGTWYRLYADIGSGTPIPRLVWAILKDDRSYFDEKTEGQFGFVRWLTDWTYFAVEVEEL
jgi:hypothetical protein